MALGGTYLTTIANSLEKAYAGSLAVTLNEKYVIWRLLQNRNKIIYKNLVKIIWKVKYGRHGQFTTIADGATLPQPGTQQKTEAVLDYKITVGMITIGRLLKQGSTSPEYYQSDAGKNALEDETKSAIDECAKNINDQLAATTKTLATDMDSFIEACGTNTNTYAGIARGANTFWRPYVNGNAGVNRALTEALLINMFTNLRDIRGATVSEVWCGNTAWYAMRMLMRTIATPINNDPTVLYAGAQSLWYEGVPFVLVPDIDTNSMLFLDQITGDGIMLIKQHESDFIVTPEATDSYDDRWSIAFHGNLECHNPWKQGHLADVQ